VIIHLAPKLRVSGAVLSSPLVFMEWTGRALLFQLYTLYHFIYVAVLADYNKAYALQDALSGLRHLSHEGHTTTI
jgi:hypothetical protein